jgi:hypothetical protein
VQRLAEWEVPPRSHPPAGQAGAEGKEMTKPPTKAERDARKAFRPVDAKKAMTEHEIAQKAFSNNRERLKAERLVREAAGPPPPKTKAPKAKGK